MKDFVKRLLFSKQLKGRRLRGGVSRGLFMSIDLQTQFQRYIGLDEREIAATVQRLIGSSRTLVDVGANDGYYTLAFLASGADCIITCEPGPANKELMANVAANGQQKLSRFCLERRLIGNKPGEATLAEILNEHPRPILIKVDVDGAELSVIQSIEQYTYLQETCWVVETHSAELEQACIDWFSAHRFETSIIDAAWWRRLIPEQRPLPHNRWLVAQPPK